MAIFAGNHPSVMGVTVKRPSVASENLTYRLISHKLLGNGARYEVAQVRRKSHGLVIGTNIGDLE